MTKTNCTVCQVPLTGGTDTFGDVHLPLCQQCWFESNEEPLCADPNYTHHSFGPMSENWKSPNPVAGPPPTGTMESEE